ncbi:UPF0149 family protein [Marinospirillum insulare]|uniref:YecA family protein n=1 Tax=Marinospirillum insulare TaxID=217169 RepID=A0ABQ5ZXF4_9GAMM|nr:UPF0149 family protein [Marinospirillum insulare]GLR64866.1 hypothetical protein GCM10007878_23040 [Marinospirillum insulare]
MSTEKAQVGRVDFDELADLCLRHRCFQSPSLFHGVLAGQLCGQERFPREHWLVLFAQLLGNETTELEGKDKQLALQLLDQTLEELSASGLSFEPLLPDELYEIEERFEGLIKWTQGFLKSLKSAKLEESKLSKEAQEGLEDLERLVALDKENLPPNEDNEKDLTAIAEFVRMVIMLLYTELHPGQPQVEKAKNPKNLH